MFRSKEMVNHDAFSLIKYAFRKQKKKISAIKVCIYSMKLNEFNIVDRHRVQNLLANFTYTSTVFSKTGFGL